MWIKNFFRTKPDYYSQFGGLWTDRKDALAELASGRGRTFSEQMKNDIAFFIRNGYVILPQAVSSERIDRYLEAFDGALSGETPLAASVPTYGPQDKSVVPANTADRYAPLTKYLDTYWHLPEALPLIFNDRTVAFLSAIFETPPFAFQGLHFETGSTQCIHQDTAYVVSESPLSLAATWLALEDIQEGSGELEYFEGSHRLPDWLYSGRYKHFNHERDQQSEHIEHLNFIQSESRKRGYPLKRFLPKKGDLLVWAADLAHGGSAITRPGATRRALVTHFTQANMKPNYFNYQPAEKNVVRDVAGARGHYSTFYY